jgi:membrane protease YdiL (CAAX protease family)
MGAYIEALILYILLFLTGSTPPSEAGFSVLTELSRVFLFNIPAIALIWHLLLKEKRLKDWGIGIPVKKDFLTGLFSLLCLLLIGIAIVFISSFFGQKQTESTIIPPSTIPSWIVLGFSCISTGYLEESFFRFYLLSKRDELKLNLPTVVILSTALFSICHIYEGPWGFLNSVLSGAFLSFIFLRFKSLHGIAIAHGLYNLAAYITSAIS